MKERISENTLNAALKRMGYKDQLTGHGIRATLSTALNELGYRKEWIDAQLSHADPNQIRAAYNHAEYVEQRRQMMQDWADHLDQWECQALSRASLEPAALGGFDRGARAGSGGYDVLAEKRRFVALSLASAWPGSLKLQEEHSE